MTVRVPVKNITYAGEDLHLVPEFRSGSCAGCRFRDWASIGMECSHATSINCRNDHTIAVRDLKQYQVDAVTYNLTGYLP
jgi:hypothetical protein